MKAKYFIETLNSKGFGPYMGVPCSFLKPAINFILDNKDTYDYYSTANEGEAMGLAAGFSLSNKIPVVMVQNSGLGNIINPLTSLNLLFKLKTLIVVTLRGEIGIPDEPQHEIMGAVTENLLKALGVKYEFLDENEYEEQVERLSDYINTMDTSVVLLLKKGFLESYKYEDGYSSGTIQRVAAIETISNSLKGDEVIISTTGKISRELYYYGKESENNFYMVGSMGCAASIALGVSLSNEDKKVIVLDGDGAVLMKMGSLSTVGKYKPNNFMHIVLDNEAYDSTGGQRCNSEITKIDEVAKACGYDRTYRINTLDDLEKTVKFENEKKGTILILIKVLKGSAKDLGRPKETCEFYKERFMNFLGC